MGGAARGAARGAPGVRQRRRGGLLPTPGLPGGGGGARRAAAAGAGPRVDLPAVRRHLEAARALCAGEPAAGANGARPASERFRWLTAPRSTVVQPSPVHTGMTDDPSAALQHLLERMVRRLT